MKKNEARTNRKSKNQDCPKCTRVIDPMDEVVEHEDLVYHAECAEELGFTDPVVDLEATAPAEKAPTVEVPESPAKKGKKMTKQEELIQKLLGAVSALTQEVAAIKARPVAQTVERPKKVKSLKGGPRPFVYYKLLGFPTEKYQPQCLRIMARLASVCPADHKMTELDIWNALMAEPFPSLKANEALGAWNYVQDPFYIFRYYKLKMVDGNYLLGPFQV